MSSIRNLISYFLKFSLNAYMPLRAEFHILPPANKREYWKTIQLSKGTQSLLPLCAV